MNPAPGGLRARQREDARRATRGPGEPIARCPRIVCACARTSSADTLFHQALVPANDAERPGINWECGEGRPKPGSQVRSCPRNCKRRARSQMATGNGKARTGSDPRARRPASASARAPSAGRQGDDDMLSALLNRSTGTAAATASTLPDRRSIAAGAAALVFGVVLVAGAGFAGPEALHNAAHDARHAMGFPCH